MKHYISAFIGVMALMLALFAVFELLGLSLFQETSELADRGLPFFAVVSMVLLTADVFLPIPASLLMMANGAYFGVAAGSLLSVAGHIGGVSLAFWIGRRGGRLLASVATPEEMETADRLFRKWGTVAVILTRPFPIIAETIVLFAGTSSMSWARLLLAAAAGAVPTAVTYAVAGTVAMTFDNMLLILGVLCSVALVFWVADYYIRRETASGE